MSKRTFQVTVTGVATRQYLVTDVNSPEEAEQVAMDYASDEFRDLDDLQVTEVEPADD